MSRTVIIREETLERVKKNLKPSKETFNNNIRRFLNVLLSDPVHAEVPKCVSAMGVSKQKLLDMMKKIGMLEYSELRRLIDETKAKIETADVETLRTINEIESNLQKTILVERYINLASWESIAKRVDYSAAHVQRLHGQALLALYKVLRSEGKE